MSLRNNPSSNSKVIHETPWARWVERPWGKEFWYGVELFDYVQVIARTKEKKYPMVRQYRPAIECHSVEFCAGLLDGEEGILETAKKELLEEAGYVGSHWTHVDSRHVDTGRLCNRVHTFVALDVERVDSFVPEQGIEPLEKDMMEIEHLIDQGGIDNASQTMGYLLVKKRGYLD